MIATRITLVCHASTSATRKGGFPNDETLDEQGLRRARAMRPSICSADRAWTSPAVRAVQTADALGITALVDPALRDCGYGRWTGLDLVSVQAAEPDALAEWMSDPSVSPHGGESYIEMLGRIGQWLDNHSQDTGHLIAVTHAAVIRAAIIHAIQATPQSFWRIDIAPLSRTVLSRNNNQWRLRALHPRE